MNSDTGNQAAGPGPASVPAAYAALTLTTLCFALNHVIGRGVRLEVPPVGLSFWRWLAAGLLLLPFAWHGLHGNRHIVLAQWRALLFMGAVMIGSTTLVLVALNSTTAVNVALINATQPVWTVLLAWLVLGEKLGRQKTLGVALGLLGVIIMIIRADWRVLWTLQFNGGDLTALLAILGFAVYSINIYKIPAALSATQSLLAIIAGGCLLLLPFYLGETLLYRSVPLTATAVVAILVIAVTVSIIAMLGWNFGNRMIGPGRAGMFINLVPVFTAILAILFLGERLYSYHLAGAVLISAGIFLVLRQS